MPLWIAQHPPLLTHHLRNAYTQVNVNLPPHSLKKVIMHARAELMKEVRKAGYNVLVER